MPVLRLLVPLLLVASLTHSGSPSIAAKARLAASPGSLGAARASAESAPGVGVPVIPRPRSVASGDGTCELARSVRISVPAGDAGLLATARVLQGVLRREAGISAVVGTSRSPGARGPGARPAEISFERAAAAEAPLADAEAYRLAIDASGIRMTASGDAGAFWAVQTLRLLLPSAAPGGVAVGSRRLPALTIVDAPRFRWRGALVDVGRHFLPPAFIERFIDLLALHKMNVLHWHLTEDQGWRIEIRKHPRLTSVGAWRTEADGTRYGGFYTQAQVREIVEYARVRHVTIVPEIEMPGHASAALVAYPELGCARGNQAQSAASRQPAAASRKAPAASRPHKVPTGWGVFEDVFCPGREETFRFLEDVLDEVMALFPSRTIHIGGDEVPKTHWKACPLCRQRMKAEGLRDEGELQAYFVRRISQYVRAKGREIAGWDEILEGGLPAGATVQVWRDVEHARTSARLGAKVVASPSSHTYINRSPADLTLAQVLTFDPVPAGLTPDEATRILGAEATLWSEGIDEANFDAMAFPRLAAFAETVWSGQPTDVAEFRARLDGAYGAKLGSLGVHPGPEDQPLLSFTPIFDPATRRVAVRADSHVTPLVCRFTTDGSRPTSRSPVFDASRWFSTGGTVRVQPFLAGRPMLDSATLEIDRHLAVGRPVVLAAPNSPKYAGTGVFSLTDSLRGSTDFHDGTWQGWSGVPMEATIDLGASVPVHSLEVGALQAMRSWILLPRRVSFWISDDGSTWRAVGEVTHSIPAERDDAFVHQFRQALPSGSRARYVKVKAENAGPLPAWHPGAGGQSWVFVDEIAVR